MSERPSWDEYFLNIVSKVAERATCERGRTACLIVKDKRIMSTGYVGSPVGLPHCDDVGHLFEKRYDKHGNESNHCIRTTHAEQNAIAQAAKFGVSIDGGTLYTKITPCLSCAKMIINAGIKRVVARKRYHKDEHSTKFLEEAGVQLDVMNQEVEKYDYQ